MILLVFMMIFAIIGAVMAGSRNRSPFLWAVICFFTGVIGIIILAVIGTDREPIVIAAPETPQIDWVKWKTLVDVDPEIGRAAAQAREKGSHAEEALAKKYLAVNDKTYLQAILKSVLDDVASGAAVPRQGTINGVPYRMLEDGSFLVTQGKLVGRTYSTFAGLQQDTA